MTIQLHSGIRWSDGAPFTAKDLVWTWNNVVLNNELTAKFPERWKSPVSGNQPSVDEIDGLTVRYTWDDPNYPHIEAEMMGRTYDTGPGLMFSPSRYMAQYHGDFGDQTEIEHLMGELEVESWADLYLIKANAYREPDRPVLSAWKTVDSADGPEWILERNPFYYAVDPAGNQLPYIDRVHLTLVKNLGAASTAAAAGEIDYQGRHMSLSKVPDYKKNADKADIYVQIASSTSPTGAVININQSYNEDPVIGDLLRTRDFRRALSLALDRDEINAEFFLGRGAPRAYVPASGTLYYPGDDWAMRYAVRDVEEANRLLDGIVLEDGGTITARDGNGDRLRPDGTGPLGVQFQVLEGYGLDLLPLVERVVKKNWKEIGIVVTSERSRTAHKKVESNEGYLFIWEAEAGWSPWVGTVWVAPISSGFRSAVEVGRYTETEGKAGEPPDKVKYKNEDGEFPMKRLLEIVEQGRAYPADSPRRIELGRELFRTISEEVIHIGTVAGVSAINGVRVIKRDLLNVPQNVGGGEMFGTAGPRPELYFFNR